MTKSEMIWGKQKKEVVGSYGNKQICFYHISICEYILINNYN